MKNQFYFFVFSIFFLVSCNESKPVQESEVYEIRSVGTLSTTEYTVGKVVKLTDKGEWYKIGERRLLISCKAKIKAGINLNAIKEGDIAVNDKKITIQLPPPEIVSLEMDPNYIRTEMEEVNGLRARFTQVEKNAILQKGEEAIRKDMKKLAILDEAEKNAIVFVKDFYRELGFEEVIVHGTEKNKRNQKVDQ